METRIFRPRAALSITSNRKMHLERIPSGWHHIWNRVVRMFNSNSGLESRKRGIVCLIFRSLLVFCALAFFVSSVALSVGPAHPFLKGKSRSSHFSRINKTSEPGVEGVGKITTDDRPPRFLEPRFESSFRLSMELLCPTVPRLLRCYYFRPPPLS